MKFNLIALPIFLAAGSATAQTGNAPLNVLSEDQVLHTAERLSGMSRGEIEPIFDDVDSDDDGSIFIAELDLLAKYFSGTDFTPELRERLMDDIETDG